MMYICHIFGTKRTNSSFILRKKTYLSKLEKNINFVKIEGDLLHLVFIYSAFLFSFIPFCFWLYSSSSLSFISLDVPYKSWIESKKSFVNKSQF